MDQLVVLVAVAGALFFVLPRLFDLLSAQREPVEPRASDAITFILGRDAKGREWIRCLKCGRTSYNPGDVEHKWCGACGPHVPFMEAAAEDHKRPMRTSDRTVA